MRPGFGRPSRAAAVVLLLVSLWGTFHRQQDDIACLRIAAEDQDASKHAFAPIAGIEHADHCAVCHWKRGLRPLFTTGAAGAPVAAKQGEVDHTTDKGLSDPVQGRQPARAPPAYLL